MQEDRMETIPPASSIDPQHELPPADSPHKSGWLRLFVWAAILLAFGVIFWMVLHHHDDSQSGAAPSRRAMAGAITITTATAQKGNIGVYLDAIGTVTPIYTDSITSQVSGMVSQVRYQEGQLVRKGQPLIEIDPRPYEAQLLQAQGALERDTNVLEQAKMDLQRYRDAWARNAIPKQTLDDKKKISLKEKARKKNDRGTFKLGGVKVGFGLLAPPITGGGE